MIVVLMISLLLASCATTLLPTDCLLQQKRAMQAIEPFSAASDRFVMRDDERGAFIRLEPHEGFTKELHQALAQWELTKLDCWGEEL